VRRQLELIRTVGYDCEDDGTAALDLEPPDADLVDQIASTLPVIGKTMPVMYPDITGEARNT